jgi:uncharacterized protein YbbK (DUF523 family)
MIDHPGSNERSMNLRPCVGISRCLADDTVRYDGTHRRHELLLEILVREVERVSVCPEVEVGMGTPREPIRLGWRTETRRPGGYAIRLVGLGSDDDWICRMQSWAQARLRELSSLGLSGYVFRARSPSCGIRGVAVSGVNPADN